MEELLQNYFGDLWFCRALIQKGMAFIYFIAFASAFNQFPALLGEKGLLPVPTYLKRISFRTAPSIFHWYYSDRFCKILAGLGALLALAAMFNLFDYVPVAISIFLWLGLWALYLSFVNVGQTFYAFGWESMLLEAGFITAFLGNIHVAPSIIPVLILRWMLFRTEMGAGLIKLRSDPCWRDLTCLFYHYETQPLPNPFSWFFHHLPKFVHRFSVCFSHFVQLLVPVFLFAPQPVAGYAAILTIVHQLLLVVSGNFSWLNWLTIVLGFSALDDRFFGLREIYGNTTFLWFDIVQYVFLAAVIIFSWKPTKNLFSKNQLMNFSYNSIHLINTYGAFGAVTKKRYEIVIEGTTDTLITNETKWLEYNFKAKPGLLKRIPPIIAPYHLRLDWLMWFLPFSVYVTQKGISLSGYDFWFIRFITKLLNNDKQTLALLRKNPFANHPPHYIRAHFYLYRFTTWKELLSTRAIWKREYIGEYLPPVTKERLNYE